MEIIASSPDLFKLSSGQRPDLPPASKMADNGVGTELRAESSDASWCAAASSNRRLKK
jgi:hypothetical protein